MTGRRAVFLDRDGTLIDCEGYLGDPEAVRPLPGAREALEMLGRSGFVRVIVTNQSGVARGYFTEEQYHAVDRAVRAALGGIDASYHCFYLPGGLVAQWDMDSEFRKPRPGMLNQAALDLDIDLATSILVGDDLRDLQAARAAGVEPVLVRTGKGADTESRLAQEGLTGIRVFDDLLGLARGLEHES